MTTTHITQADIIEDLEASIRHFTDKLSTALAQVPTNADDAEEQAASIRYNSEQLNKYKTRLLQATR